MLTAIQNNLVKAQPRSLKELTADKSGWDAIKASIKTAKNDIVVLAADRNQASDALLKTQVTTHSTMGAVIYFTGGILVDNGWIRILGSGSDKLTRSLPAWNKGKTFKDYGDTPGFLLIADDAIGGFFAINGGQLGKDAGNVYYLAPETLKWESLNRAYSDFLEFCFNGNLDEFYKPFRWKGWHKDIGVLNGDQVFSFYPFLWSKEGKNIAKLSRKIVPIQEQYNFNTSH